MILEFKRDKDTNTVTYKFISSWTIEKLTDTKKAHLVGEPNSYVLKCDVQPPGDYNTVGSIWIALDGIEWVKIDDEVVYPEGQKSSKIRLPEI